MHRSMRGVMTLCAAISVALAVAACSGQSSVPTAGTQPSVVQYAQRLPLPYNPRIPNIARQDGNYGGYTVERVTPMYLAASMTTVAHHRMSEIMPTPRPTIRPTPCYNKCNCGALMPTAQTDTTSPGGGCPLAAPANPTAARRFNVTATPDPQYGTGQAGFAFRPVDSTGNPIGDGSYWDAITIYYNSATDTSIPAPPSGAANYVITTSDLGPFGNCLEFDVIYSYGLFPNTTGVDDRLGVYDYCANGGQGAWGAAQPINASFISTYVRTYGNGDGHPQAEVQSLRYPDGTWHALLYNATKQEYDDIYQSAAATSTVGDGTGDSMFFASYASNVNCPKLDVVGQSGLRLYTGASTNNGYAELWSLGTSAYQINTGAGPCFWANIVTGTPSVPYYLYENNASIMPNDSAWAVQMGT